MHCNKRQSMKLNTRLHMNVARGLCIDHGAILLKYYTFLISVSSERRVCDKRRTSSVASFSPMKKLPWDAT
eukprot:6214733-Pleurochrysis_carterae.AAC.2